MKGAVVFLALFAVAFSVPQPRKVFHEHVEEFLEIIGEEAGHELEHLMEHYAEFEEFWVSVNYIKTADFKNLVYEMESLPEFKAVIDFLEKDNIDILYFVDRFNALIDQNSKAFKKARHNLSGRDFSSFIKDCIDNFPKEQLAALFDQKMAEDEEFSVAIKNLYSNEWFEIYGALWKSEAFRAEVKTLGEHGIHINELLNQLMAVFGQN